MSTVIAYDVVNVLNASYMPLGATKLKRALDLVIRGEAVIEEADESRLVRHANGEYKYPLVIRMLRMIKVPIVYAEKAFSRRGVLERDKFKCGYCAGVATTHDHIVPKSRGGGDTWMNAISACFGCNNKKDNRTPEEANMPLLFQPSVPMEYFLRSGKKPKKKRKGK